MDWCRAGPKSLDLREKAERWQCSKSFHSMNPEILAGKASEKKMYIGAVNQNEQERPGNTFWS
jgi:hypothetical protein